MSKIHIIKLKELQKYFLLMKFLILAVFNIEIENANEKIILFFTPLYAC